MFFYCLNKNVILRKENGGVVLMYKNKNDNILFFYAPNNFKLFSKLKNNNTYIGINLLKYNSKTDELFFFLSYMIKRKIFISKEKIESNSKIIKLKVAPKLISLFITPTIHFRRFYENKK
ncbi:hypothetical protein KAI65_04755 [Candidatus Parcubacteria bacterium]|nr:hypothetical protein [Candidatus Parcubacteria bacterium]